ncbi:hypothetical protein C8J57DRAFT_1086018 [Mycena rebaudengoi]|nr:hypothetical protein C8J57DRAFT_1086018 [Mycena rebaudengoi]
MRFGVSTGRRGSAEDRITQCLSRFVRPTLFCILDKTGANGTDNGIFPPDDELREILFDFERKSLSLDVRLQYLREKHHIKIGLTKLKALNRKFDVPSSRKFRAVEEATEAIADIISRDIYQGQGPDTVKKIASLRLNLTIPRYVLRSTEPRKCY